ncbi:hypothetical protein [Cognatilysobacter tabacisoli]|uniref:hypothetical protein n=1 Tax=Cognatilysobacter tabacisoli TaxID=2315424 RepID=UPI000E6B1A24|nr:hypothetical protein [Lysobacter tabacisoli]
MSPAAPATPPAPAALAAFLRGVERRGAVLAELQGGDAAAGDAALAAAMAAFRIEAADRSMSEWPAAFWARLLAEPRLHQRTAVAIAIDATDRLGAVGSGPRAALLLRLAGGLGDDEAAAALGIAPGSYRLALRRALEQVADGSDPAAAWAQLREQIHRRIKGLSPERLTRLADARERALRGDAARTSPALPAATAAPAPRRRALLALLWLLLVLCVLGLLATFWWPPGMPQPGWLAASGDARVTIAPLPPAEPPRARLGPDGALLGHPDFDLLADPDGEAQARELGFHSWLAAQAASTETDPLVEGVTAADAAWPAGAPGLALPPVASETRDAPR